MLLKNIRVIDLSQYIPGPYITRMLADLGAQVIKVEPPAGDPMRSFKAAAEKGISQAYHALNHGKRIIRLDLKAEPGLAKLKQLLAGADVLIDGFRPGVLDRLGLSEQAITEINATLIHCALTGFGQTGPSAKKAGHDLGYCAVAGILGSHNKDKAPQFSFPPVADHVGGLQACNTILAALYSRTQTGKGVYIDASLYEPVLAWHYLMRSEHISHVLGGSAAYYNIYRTGDGKFISLSALEYKFWKKFCMAISKPQWIQRHKDDFPQLSLISELTGFFQTRTKAQLDSLLETADCCYEPVADINNVDDHPQTAYRGTRNRYPNIVNGQRLAASDIVVEIDDFENIDWD